MVLPKVHEDERSRCRIFEELVAKPWFEPLFAGFIFLNTTFMAAEVQYNGMDYAFEMDYPGEVDTAANTWPAAAQVFAFSEIVFGLVFTMELAIKLLALRLSFFSESWNWLDALIVVFWFIGLVGKTFLPLDPMLLRLVRLMRLMRMLRLVRTLQSFESLYLMTTSIKASIMALMWSTALLFLVQVSIAVVLNQLLIGFILDEDNPEATRGEVYRYFGTFSKALLTMFEFMLANWPPSSRVLTEGVNELYVIFVLGYQCIIGFAVVKVIMGVFLQITFNIASTDDVIMVSQKERAIRTHTKKISQLFQAADQDGNGVIDKEEFRDMVEDPVVIHWLASMDCDVSLFARDPDVLFSLVDDGDEELTAEELVKGVARMKGLARSIDLAVLAEENRQVKGAVQRLGGQIAAMLSMGSWDAREGGPGAGGSGAQALRSSTPSTMSSGDEPGSRSSRPQEGAAGAPPYGRAARSSISERMFGGPEEAPEPPAPTKGASPGSRLSNWVRSPRFEGLFASLIVLNILVMAAQVQYIGMEVGFRLEYQGSVRSAEDAWPWAEVAFIVTDWLFLVLFTLEVVLKILVCRLPFFKEAWNWFDLTIVLCGILETSVLGMLPLELGMLRLFRLARLLRILRLIRTQGFDSLYLMATSIKGSLSALLWSTVLMFVVQMLIALLLGTMLESYLLDDTIPEEDRHTLFVYFGTFSKAMLTMFEITLANWIPVCRALTENVSEWYVIFALIHKFIIGFAAVMVVTGVFLQETFKVAATDDTIMIITKQRQVKIHTKKMSVLFKAADEDGNGILDREEFKAMVDDPNVATWLASMGLEVTDADTLFTMVSRESDGRGQITAAELAQGVSRLKGSAKSVDMAAVMHENRQLLEEAQRLQRQVGELKRRCQSRARPGEVLAAAGTPTT